jgi:hypothetical protein
MWIGEAHRPRPLAILGGSPMQGYPLEAVEEPGEPIPVEEAKALLDALCTQLNMPASLPRRARRRVPPALPGAEDR